MIAADRSVLTPEEGGLYPAIDEVLEARWCDVGNGNSGRSSAKCINTRRD